MTFTQAGSTLLTHFATEERRIPDATLYPGRNAWVIQALNSALQECWIDNLPWVRPDERGVMLYAPRAVTVACTTGSTTATITGWAAWMAGCSIVIEGADNDNQIRNNAAAAVLKFPYTGTTGTHAATVYCDCVTLGTDVLKVIAPVKVDRLEIWPCPDPKSVNVSGHHDFGFTGNGEALRVAPSTGNTIIYGIETWSPSAVLPPVTRLRLQPAPKVAALLEYKIEITPPVVTRLDSTAQIPIPFLFCELCLMPIARKRLTGSPFFRDDGNAGEIETGYQTALAELQKLNPNRNSGIKIVAAY